MRLPGEILQGILARAALVLLRVYLGVVFLISAVPKLRGDFTTGLMAFLEKAPMGIVMTPDVGIYLPGGNLRSPDVSFVRAEKLPGGVPPRGFGDFVPDLAVEVLSPSDAQREVADKIGEYLQCGVPIVWLVDPDSKSVTVFRSLTDVRRLESSDTISAEPVLPGFSCRVSQFF